MALFDQIPDEYIEAAANINMYFLDRSVGLNISEGLTCLSYPNDEAAPHDCKVYIHPGTPPFHVDPSEVNWSRPGGYNRNNWTYETWGSGCGMWSEQTRCFINRATALINQYAVLSFQFSYLEVAAGSTIANMPGGWFYDDPNPNRSNVYDLEAFEAQYPDKIIIYWTTSLARSIGSNVSESFNQQMRDYAVDHDKILFDVADILSHDPNGNPCYDNRDGVPYANTFASENFPNDGQNLLSICQHYTSETVGGHLGSVSAGKIRVAKAYWVLMAQIAGWDPN